jgi:uncharacterized OB-fold protein
MGMIDFDGGGRLMVEITDAAAEDLHVALRMRMSFRIKDFDEMRGFRRYFWKAVPDLAPSSDVAVSNQGEAVCPPV